MAMTGLVKDELSRVTIVKPCCRKAEVSTLLRFAGGLHLAAGRIVVEAELDTGAAPRHADSQSHVVPETTCLGSPRTGRP